MPQLVQLDNDNRLLALQNLGYDINKEGFVYNKTTGEVVICKYSKEESPYKHCCYFTWFYCNY